MPNVVTYGVRLNCWPQGHSDRLSQIMTASNIGDCKHELHMTFCVPFKDRMTIDPFDAQLMAALRGISGRVMVYLTQTYLGESAEDATAFENICCSKLTMDNDDLKSEWSFVFKEASRRV